MFGYVNVNRKELNEVDNAIYQSYYCGLCRQLKEIAGIKGQMLLNYDMTFLAILLTGLYELENEECKFICPIHPTKKRCAYVNEAIEYAAAMDVALSYHSLLDDYRDDGSKVKNAMAKALQKDYNRISLQYPRQIKAIEEYIEKLSAAEKAGETNVDLVSGYTGEVLSVIFNWKEDVWAKDLESMGFYMGKFIYLMDAYEDIESDDKKNRYNHLLELRQADSRNFETCMKSNLTSLMSECAKSFERMPILMHAEIIRNILYSGVWTKYEYIHLKEKSKDKNKDKNKEVAKEF